MKLLSGSRPDPSSEGHDRVPVDASDLARRADEVGDEVDAFLAGRLVEHLLAISRPVPAWAVLNKVAHGTPSELSELARCRDEVTARVPDQRTPAWLEGQWSLAADLLEGAVSTEEFARTQRAVLIPLELWLIERSMHETLTSRRMIEIASQVLADVFDRTTPPTTGSA